nr:complement C1q protein [uncultured Mediterranean phage uvMED]
MTKANFVSGVGGANTPAFEATLSSNFTFSSATDTKLPFATETFDTDSAYDNSSNYRFTPQTAGKYVVYLWTRHNPSSTNNISNAYTYIKKNGSYAASFYQDHHNDANVLSVGGSRVIELNGSSDYVEAFVFQTTSATPQIDQGTYTFFGAYKLIGV